MFSLRDFTVFFLLPVLNFVMWFKMGQKSIMMEASNGCIVDPPIDQKETTALQTTIVTQKTGGKKKNILSFDPPQILDVDSGAFSSYSEEALVEMFFPGKSRTLLLNHHSEPCTGYINPMVNVKQECLAVAVTDSKSSSLDLRFNGGAKTGPVIIDSKCMIADFLLNSGQFMLSFIR